MLQHNPLCKNRTANLWKFIVNYAAVISFMKILNNSYSVPSLPFSSRLHYLYIRKKGMLWTTSLRNCAEKACRQTDPKEPRLKFFWARRFLRKV